MGIGPEPRIRSLLFGPGNQERKLQRVFEFGSDAVILDLEDSVPNSEKLVARQMVRDTVLRRANQPGPLLVVRVNPLETGLTEGDLDAVVLPGLFAIHVTKPGSPEQVRRLDQMVTALEEQRGIPPGSIRFICSVDSAYVVMTLPEIAQIKRIYCFIVGGADFAADIGITISEDMIESLWARSYAVLVSRAAGKSAPIHPSGGNLSDEPRLRRVLDLGKRLGFQGGMAVHPKQLGPIHEIFSPSEQEVAHARRVVEEFRAAESSGVAAISLDGELVDYAHAKRAEAILRMVGEL